MYTKYKIVPFCPYHFVHTILSVPFCPYTILSATILSGHHRNNRQSMTIGDQSMLMFHDDVTHRIHLAMSSIGHPCSTTQGSARYLSLMTVQALREVYIFINSS